jgi:glucokinase
MARVDEAGAGIVAVDLGGTRIRAAVLREGGGWGGRIEVATPIARGPAAVVGALADLVERVVAGDPDLDHGEPARVVVGATGPFDRDGSWIDPSNLGPAFHGYPLGRRLADRLGRPVVVGLDTHLALLGERRAGALQGCRDGVFITVSTGVGGAFLVDDRVVAGVHGIAGEVGHLPVAAGGPRCGCGARGHLEAYASGPALAREGMLAARAGRSPRLLARSRSGARGLTGADVAAAEAAGDPAARAIMERGRRALGRAVTGLVNVLDPERVVLGGGVVLGDPEPWVAACRRALATGALATQRASVEIVVAVLGDDAGLVGCLDHERLGGRWTMPDPSSR